MIGGPILVTGGAGFLGSALTHRLVKRGDRVRVLDNGFRGNWKRLNDIRAQLDCVEGDVRDASAVSAAMRDVRTVFHLAYVNGTRFFYELPHQVLEVGVKGISNVMDAAVANRVHSVVLISSSEVYNDPERMPTPESERLIVPDPLNPRFSYAGGKIISELMTIHYARHHKFRWKVLRPHNVYGPDMGAEHVVPEFILRALKLKAEKASADQTAAFPLQGDGSESRAFCFVDDAVQGILLASSEEAEDGIYNIGTEEVVAISDLAHAIADILGIRIKLCPGPSRKGEPHKRCPDTAKIRRLGYRPGVPLNAGLKRACDWYASHLSETPLRQSL